MSKNEHIHTMAFTMKFQYNLSIYPSLSLSCSKTLPFISIRLRSMLCVCVCLCVRNNWLHSFIFNAHCIPVQCAPLLRQNICIRDISTFCIINGPLFSYIHSFDIFVRFLAAFVETRACICEPSLRSLSFLSI